MVRKFLNISLSLTLSLAVSVFVMPPSPVYAASPAAESSADPNSSGPRKHLATIIFAALAGAILGLSTLSFYGRPQEKLQNIAIGGAIGAITGTVYTTYKMASAPRDFYGDLEAQPELWRLAEVDSSRLTTAALPTANGQFQLGLHWSF